ncbi:MAG: hypothetical protein ACREYF_26555 [Gammaproteobacteria bacterium]
MNHKASPETKDRALALFALAATDTPQATSCPSEETLAQFIDGRLSGQGREAMLAHLNRCRACYHHWLEVTAYLTSSDSAAPAPGNTRPAASLWQRLQIWFGDWSIAVPVAVSVVVVFALVLWWPRSPDLNAELDLAYAKLRSEHAAFAQASLPLPWEGAALGFSESQASTPRRAFGAGLWTGKHAFSGTNKEALPEFLTPPGALTWPETEWAEYYALGRWMMLVWTLAASEPNKGDWREQAAIGQRLHSELSKQGARPEGQRPTAALERLQAQLAALQREANARHRAELRRSLEIAMQQLAP